MGDYDFGSAIVGAMWVCGIIGATVCAGVIGSIWLIVHFLF